MRRARVQIGWNADKRNRTTLPVKPPQMNLELGFSTGQASKAQPEPAYQYRGPEAQAGPLRSPAWLGAELNCKVVSMKKHERIYGPIWPHLAHCFSQAHVPAAHSVAVHRRHWCPHPLPRSRSMLGWERKRESETDAATPLLCHDLSSTCLTCHNGDRHMRTNKQWSLPPIATIVTGIALQGPTSQ